MKTRFRAYQLGNEGALFSHFKQNDFTLIEARLPKEGIEVLFNELEYCGKKLIDRLHITSWDKDHCNYDDLIQLLNHFRPNLIQYPDYEPETENGKLCKATIDGYDDIHNRYSPNVQPFKREYLFSLPNATEKSTGNVIFHPEYNAEKSNDKSLMKLFRSNGFNVLSLGDVESSSIASRLLSSTIIKTEVDILILPHHGADNGFTTSEFIDQIKPKMVICSANFGNQYDHPKESIRQIFAARNIPLLTTKRGDIIIEHPLAGNLTTALNLISNNENQEDPIRFIPKKHS